MNRKRIASLALSAALLTLSFASTAHAIHRKGCEFPLKDVEVCWEASAEIDAPMSPYPEVHLFPVTQRGIGEDGVLVDYTRALYRQILPSNLTQRLVQEWRPAFHLEEAVDMTQQEGWETALWIAPRVLRNSSAGTPGVVDWDAYLLTGEGKPMRTMRIRVTSNPHREKKDVEAVTTVAGLSLAAGKLFSNPAETALTAFAAAATADEKPPEAGYSLELMTELAMRQVLFLAQHDIEDLIAAPPPQKSNIITSLFNRDERAGQPTPLTAGDPQPAPPDPIQHIERWWERVMQ
ncbi:hypothetical protein [Magnetofaba australis]|nr:hypothetical protein [Magnetofaba australis]